LSDFWPHSAVAEKYDVMRKDGSNERAILIINKDCIIRSRQQGDRLPLVIHS